ncbi:ovarian cancer G-protein coupled receptor 1-like [Narcine bancroftii]|uniref:ovarian cancer G-protein coupled receptor 1-like n=1 Tax=Narcine bancroftii TaxID=1343680 RepID=UPI0038317A91
MANQGQCHGANCTNCTLDYEIHQSLFSAIYIFIFIVSLPSSLLSLYHSYLQIRRGNELGIYLCNLTISDLLHLSCFPLWIHYLLNDDNWVHGELLCRLTGLILYENIYVSIAFLCCISINRYLAVVHPLRFHTLRTVRVAFLISVLVWTKEIGMSLFIFEHNEMVKDQNNHLLCFEHYPIQSWQKGINYYRFAAGFLLPILVLVFLYNLILMSIHKSKGLRHDQKLRIKKLVLCTVTIFFFCFTPYHIVLLIRTLYETDCYYVKKLFHFYHFGLLITSLNCVADPLLYSFVSESTRGVLMRLLEPLVNLIHRQPMERVNAPDSSIFPTPATRFPSSRNILLTSIRIGTADPS